MATHNYKFAIAPQYLGNDNQWRITWINEDGEEDALNHIYEVSVTSLYHCLASELNAKYGKNYKFSKSEILRTNGAAISNADGFKNGNWYLERRWSELLLMHNRPDIYPCNYGNHTLEFYCALAEFLGEWLENNDIHRLSYENCKQQWLSYKSLGIGFTPYDQYKHFYDEDIDFTPSAFAKANREIAERAWEIDSENALVLWDTPYEVVKVEMNRQYVRFYRKDDALTAYTYPPLHELKHNKEFIECLTDCLKESNQYDEGDINSWIEGSCDIPPFPISVIFHCDYVGDRSDWFIDYELR